MRRFVFGSSSETGLRGWLIFCLPVFFFLLGSGRASRYDVAHDFSPPDMWALAEGGIYASRDPGRPGKAGRAEIRIDLTFERTKSEQEASMEITLVRPEQEKMLGYTDLDTGESFFCCTKDLLDKKAPGCNEVGKIIYNRPRTLSPLKGGMFTEPLNPEVLTFKKRERVTIFNESMLIHRTGIYQVVFSACDENLGNVSSTGDVAFRNPYGYLPGQLYGSIPFYRVLSVSYAVVTLLWLLVFFIYRRVSLPLHRYMSIALILGLGESIVSAWNYTELNVTGRPVCCPVFPGIVAAAILSVLKTVPSKVLVLLICMGWTIVYASLDRIKRRWVVIYAFTTLVLSFVHQLAVLTSHHETVSLKVFISLPMYVLDFVYMAWVFLELRKTRNYLKDRGATEKNILYRRFKNALLGFVVGILVWGVFGVVNSLRSTTADRWRFVNWKLYWMVGGVPPGGVMWDLMYFLLLLVIILIFFPGEKTSQYVYRPEDDLNVNAALVSGTGRDSDDDP
uniref:GOST seven transmembrane domain-containing protein n=1 Tax=Rhodosorus marinus TaxID=101924 RepID=A0A7S2ZYV8_9RHOD|mmetsp:Transcript_38098/g.151196  ORF Transcript_38098/g.151196 Transcript_38098/m.151196 type:complete len:507 (+) Transcript_38098:267-1787(+)